MNLARKVLLGVGCVLFGCSALLLVYVLYIIIDVTVLIAHPSPLLGKDAVVASIIYTYAALLIASAGCLCLLPHSWFRRSQRLAGLAGRTS